MAAGKTYYWNGDAADGDHQNDENWAEADGAALASSVPYPGGKTGVDDSIVYPSWATHAVTTNLDNSASDGTIVNVTVEDGFPAYAIGTRENPLYLKMGGSPALKFDSADHGDIYLVTGTAAVVSCNVLKTAASDDALHLAFGGTICTLLNILGGTVVLDAALFGVTNLGATTMNVGKQTVLSPPNVALAAPIGTMLNNRGGIIDWLAGTVDELKNFSGTFRCEKSTTARTLTASTIYGGVVDFRTGVPGTLTLTAAIAKLGGEVYWDDGESLQRS